MLPRKCPPTNPTQTGGSGLKNPVFMDNLYFHLRLSSPEWPSLYRGEGRREDKSLRSVRPKTTISYPLRGVLRREIRFFPTSDTSPGSGPGPHSKLYDSLPRTRVSDRH